MQDFISELKWRGLIHDVTPGIEEHFKKGMVRAYIGFDPTAPSMTIGNYVQIMLLTFLQRAGHQPVVLLGGATSRIGDPSGKDKERDLKSTEELDRNTEQFMNQAKNLLDIQHETYQATTMAAHTAWVKGSHVLVQARLFDNSTAPRNRAIPSVDRTRRTTANLSLRAATANHTLWQRRCICVRPGAVQIEEGAVGTTPRPSCPGLLHR
jgi:tyrosyl-tRNA synthetase